MPSVPTTDPLFLLPSASAHDPRVDAWLGERSDDLGEVARLWFEALRACGDDVRELMHDGHATACVGEAAFAYVGSFKAHVSVGFFRGAELADPAGLLEGSGKRMRHVKVRVGDDIDDEALARLVDAAYRDMRSRLSGA